MGISTDTSGKGGLRATLEQWQSAIDERVRAILPNLSGFQELEKRVADLTRRVEELEQAFAPLRPTSTRSPGTPLPRASDRNEARLRAGRRFTRQPRVIRISLPACRRATAAPRRPRRPRNTLARRAVVAPSPARSPPDDRSRPKPS